MIVAAVRALVAVLLLGASAGCASARAEDRAFTVDEMLKIEGVGAAVIDPSGSWLVYERLRPYEQSRDFSFRTYAMGKTGHQLWRYDLTSGGAPHLLPGLDPDRHAYLQGLSPSGRRLAVMQYSFGELALGAYDLAQDRLVTFQPTPAFSRSGDHNPVWISDDEIVFAALPDGAEPALTSIRAKTGRWLAAAWRSAWSGETSTGTEVRTFPRDEGHQLPGRLVRANAHTGEIQTLAEGLFADLRLSPDGRWLAALSVHDALPVKSDDLVQETRQSFRLVVFDLNSGTRRSPAQALETYPYTIAWSSDGERLAVYGWSPDQDVRLGRFHVLDVSSMELRRYDHVGLELTSERERGWMQRPERTVFLGDALAVHARRIPSHLDQSPRFAFQDFAASGLPRADWYRLAPDGSSLNLTETLASVSSVPVHAGDDHLTVLAADGVYRIDASGDRRRLTPALEGRFTFQSPGTFATRAEVIRPDDMQEALFRVTGHGQARIVMLDLENPDRTGAVVVDAPSAEAAPLAGSVAAGVVLFRAEAGPVSRLLVASPGGAPALREIDAINTHLAEVELGQWRVVSYDVIDPASGNAPQRVESCVLLPPNFDPAFPPPLIVDVYPAIGPSCKRPGHRRMDFPDPHSEYIWAGKGYAYARLTTPRNLINTPDGPLAGLPAVISAGVDALIAERLADPDRLVLHGFSQGGVSALYTAAHAPRFKAVIAKNSWADLFSHYFGSGGVYGVEENTFGAFARYDPDVGSDFGFGRTPFDDPEAYYRNSPVFLAPQMAMPVLLFHTDMDGFAMYQFDEMFGALKRAGKDARYVRYWGEGHGPSSPANIRDMWSRIDKFLRDAGAAASQ